MATNGEILNLYDLRDNPFDPRLKYPLSERERELYARVEGFGRQVQDLDDWFERANASTWPVAFLVHGPNGCGRTSAVGYIVTLFKDAVRRGDSLADTVVFSRTPKEEDGVADVPPILQLLADVFDALGAAGVPFQGSAAGLPQLYMDFVFKDGAPLRMLQLIATQSADQLRSKSRYPVVILEDVQKYKQIESLMDVFQKIPLVIITTADDGIRRDFESGTHKVLSLGQLTIDDIVEFINQRWKAVSRSDPPTTTHPFERLALEGVFKPKPTWEFKGVVGLLTEIFMQHVVSLQATGVPKDPVPINHEDMRTWAYNYSWNVPGRL